MEWEEERRQLVGEKAVLQDVANRLNVQVRSAKEDARKVAESERAGEQKRAGIQGVCMRVITARSTLIQSLQELDKAKKAIADLEANLKTERAQLRALTAEQNRIQRERDNVSNQLHRTESVSCLQLKYSAIPKTRRRI